MAPSLELLQGTLDLLVLKALSWGSRHGYAVSTWIRERSGEEFLVEEGALYPALQRLETKEWISAKWGTSSNNRKARFYSLTKGGRKQLAHETSRWRKLAAAIGRVLGPEIMEG